MKFIENFITLTTVTERTVYCVLRSSAFLFKSLNFRWEKAGIEANILIVIIIKLSQTFEITYLFKM